MKVLFICWRPYQLFNAINFIANNIENTRGNSDLFISNLPSLTGLKEKIEETCLFNHIGLFDGLEEKSLRKRIEKNVQGIIGLFPQKAINHYIINGFPLSDYDVIVSSGYCHFFVKLANMYSTARIIFLEDGTSHYTNMEKNMYSRQLSQRILKKVFNKGILTIKPEKYYVYHPELVENTNNDFFCQLPDINKSYKYLVNIFGDAVEILPCDKRILYLYEDSCFKAVKKNRVHLNEQKLNKVLSKYNDKLLVRLHPAMRNGPDCMQVDNRRYMWEISAKYLTENDIIVSRFSTASLTPFLLYGVVPNIVFLYELNDNPSVEENNPRHRFMEKFKKIYPGKIYIPKSYDELQVTIDSILSDKSE